MMKSMVTTPALVAADTGISLALGFCLAIGTFVAAANPAMAAETDWQENLGGQARLISTGPIDPDTQTVRIAIQIDLKKGWKTYWRSPGDTGIPPEFDFSRSSNLKEYEILWPAPKSFADDYGASIGYKDGVTLPVRAVARSRNLPMVIDLTMRYGVCERICVPVENQFSLVVTRSSLASDSAAALIDQAFDSVPTPAAADDAMAIKSVSQKGKVPTGNLIVTTRVSAPAEKTELFIEGPENWYFPLPVRTSGNDDKIEWSISLADLPEAGGLSGNYVTFTLVNGKQAVEQIWHLD